MENDFVNSPLEFHFEHPIAARVRELTKTKVPLLPQFG